MVNFLKVLLLLASTPALAVYVPGTIGTVQICGQTLSTTNLIHLYCYANGASNRCNFRLPTNQTTGAAISAGYTPSGSRKFRVQAMQISTRVSNTTSFGELAYSDNDLGFASSGSWTNPVFIAGQAAGSGQVRFHTTNADSANSSMQINFNCIPVMNFLVPNGKYLGFKTDGTAAAWAEVYGYEE